MQLSKLKFVQICLMASLFVTQAALANVVGSVIFTTGDVSVTHADNTVAQIEKNAALNTGDTLETRDGRVQFSLVDGGKVSLQPNSIFKINKYEFSGKEDGSEFAFMELVKGGLRTITGLIGHKNRERYQLKTTVATIGIRGTEFTVNFNDNQFLMTTNHGSVDVCGNSGNCLNAVTGQSIAVSAGGAPKFSSKAAKAAAAAPESSKAVFTASDTMPNLAASTTTANPTNPTPVPTSVNNSTGTIVTLAIPNNILNVQSEVLNANVQTDAAGNPTNINSQTLNYNVNPLSFASYASDGVVAWGQADSGTFSGNNTSFNMTKYNYIIGATPTPSNLASLSGTYNVIGSTAPFFASSSGTVSSAGVANTSGLFTFNFATGPFSYAYNLTVNTAIGGVTTDTYTLNGGGNGFKANNAASFGLNGTVTTTGNSCQTGCTGVLNGSTTGGGNNLIQGAFLGVNGERIGLQYGFAVPGLGGNIYGGAVLR